MVAAGQVTTRALVAFDVAAKLALIGLLLHAVANPDLPQYADKAMQARAVAYPFAAVTACLSGCGRADDSAVPAETGSHIMSDIAVTPARTADLLKAVNSGEIDPARSPRPDS
jgi:hypothetical protein